eukprot:SAG31_NODE_36487_length_313_cov_0.336449_1_plen_42_part_01
MHPEHDAAYYIINIRRRSLIYLFYLIVLNLVDLNLVQSVPGG